MIINDSETPSRAQVDACSIDRTHSARWIAGVLGVFVGLSVCGIWWGLPNFESWSNDDDTPLGPLSAAAGCFREFDKYPPVSHIANSIVYSPYIAYLYVTGNLTIGAREYPYGFSDPIHQMTVLLVLSRVLSVVAATLTVFCVQRLARALGLCFAASVAAAALMATSCEVVLFAHVGNVETLLNLFFVLCLVSAARAGTERMRPYVLIGLWAALALATKESIWGALVGIACFVVVEVFRRSDWRLRAILDRRLLLSLAVFVGSYVCFGTAFAFDTYRDRISNWIEHAGEMAALKAQITPLDVLWRTVSEMEMATSFPHLIAMAAGCLLLWRTNRRALAFLAIVVVVYYITVLAPVKLVWARYTIPIAICSSVAGGAFLAAMLQWQRVPKWVRTVGVLVPLACGGARCLASDVLMMRDSRYEAEHWLVNNVPSDARLEYYGPSSYFPRFQLIGLSANEVRPEAMTLDALQRRHPDFIVLSSNALHRTNKDPDDGRMLAPETANNAAAFIDTLLSGHADYEVVIRMRTSVWFHRNNRFAWDVHSRISPTIIILKRAAGK